MALMIAYDDEPSSMPSNNNTTITTATDDDTLPQAPGDEEVAVVVQHALYDEPPVYEYAISSHPQQDEEHQRSSSSSCDGFCKAFVCMGLLVVAGVAYISVLFYQRQQPIPYDFSHTTPSVEQLEAYFDHLLETLSPEVSSVRDPTTAAFEALEWMAFTDAAFGLQLDEYEAIRQRYALILMYFSTGGFDFWDNTWLINGISECDFEGVICNDNGAVTQLDLKSRSLVGPLPAQIAWLDRLQVLDLRANRLSGSLPQEILVGCAELEELELSFNRLIGHGPRDLSALSHLRRINMQGNALTGTLPPTLPETLQLLILDQNNLSGSIPVTWFEGTGHQLEILDLSGNTHINGTLSPDIGHWSHLRSISIGSTEISGTIPSEIGDLVSLEEFSIVNTRLSGTLPSEFYRLTSLQWIVAGYIPLAGTLSPQIGELSDLQVLQISHTLINGTLPTEVGSLPQLEWLQISNTELSGILPTELGQLSLLSKFAKILAAFLEFSKTIIDSHI
jgi:hypothetical protein